MRLLQILIWRVIASSFSLLAATAIASEPLAFPRAEGWAAHSPGGRGGKVIKVTNLKPRGRGSLKAAIQARGPRTVVFEVGGIIDLKGTFLTVKNPFLTIAGQTAPNPGITIIDGGIKIWETNDVIIQHIRVRPGAARHLGKKWEPDSINVYASNQVIIDHCSTSWAIDENLSVAGPRFSGTSFEKSRLGTSHDVTISNCIISECLTGPGKSPKGSLINYNTTNILITKNFYSQQGDRQPGWTGGTSGAEVNNVIYNGPGSNWFAREHEWKTFVAIWNTPPVSYISVVGNIFQRGSIHPKISFFVVKDELKDMSELSGKGPFALIYLEDNLVYWNDGTSDFTTAMISEKGVYAPEHIDEKRTSWNDNIRVLPSGEVADYVLKNVGARPWEPDPVDDRILSDWQNLTGRNINWETDVGGFPDLPSTTRSTSWDTDGDGMPNNWEELKGLDPNQKDDKGLNLDANKNYTNIEIYLHELNRTR